MPFLLFSEFFISAVLYFCGAADISEIPESELERFEQFVRHPVALNSATERRLAESGLMSEYQAASLVDYRTRNGTVASERELSLVDGFNATFVHYLLEFATLADNVPSGQVSHSEEVAAGTQVKINEGKTMWTGMGKAGAEVSGRFGDISASVAYKMGNDVSWSSSYAYGKYLRRVVLGAFNARFGQGLLQWSGVSMDSYAAPASLMRRSSGISPYTGWSPSYAMMGAAASFDFGSVSFSPFADIKGRSYGANVGWNHSYGRVGATVSYNSGLNCAFDFQHSVKGMVFYAEGRYTWLRATSRHEGAALVGSRIPVGRTDNAIRLRMTMDKADAALSTSWADGRLRHNVSLGALATLHVRDHGRSSRGDWQLKATGQYRYSGRYGLSLMSRVNARLTQDMLRADIRQDIQWERQWLTLSARGDGVLYMGSAGSCLSGLLSAQAAFRFSWLSSVLQCSMFNVGNWDSRIYLYQYDAPGAFNIPAMYGRGYFVALYSSFKLTRWAKLYFRTGLVSYPWAHKNDARQRSSLDARLQLNCLIIPTRRN